jgi:hypothetical protein
MPDTTDIIIDSILKTADAEHWTAAERLQAMALLASDRPASKPSYKSWSFWLLGLTAAASVAVAVTGAFSGSKTAAAVGTVAATVLVGTQAITNSKDKRAAGTTAARKLEAAMSGPTPPPANVVPVFPPAACKTCGGTGKVFCPNADGKVDPLCPTRPCPACQAP